MSGASALRIRLLKNVMWPLARPGVPVRAVGRRVDRGAGATPRWRSSRAPHRPGGRRSSTPTSPELLAPRGDARLHSRRSVPRAARSRRERAIALVLIARQFLESLACKYRLVLEEIERVSGTADRASCTSSAAERWNDVLCQPDGERHAAPRPGRPGRGGSAREHPRAAPRLRLARLRWSEMRELVRASVGGPTAYEPDRRALQALGGALRPLPRRRSVLDSSNRELLR